MGKAKSSNKKLLFVGHMSLAFLIVYFISTRFRGIRKTVSIALVMFLSILPDIDLMIRLAGIDLGHRTITHSVVIWLAVGGIMISFFTKRYRKGPIVAVYLIAYLSHLMIGDIIVGPINILYPVGDFVVSSSIKGLQNLLLETLLFTIMATVVIKRYYIFQRTNEDIFLFRYRPEMDSFLYPVLVLALIGSFFWVLAKFDLSLVEVSLAIPLHSAAICMTIFIWRASKNIERQR